MAGSLTGTTIQTGVGAREAAPGRLLAKRNGGGSVAETCLYFAAEKAGWHHDYLVLNGDGVGPITNVTMPSCVAPAYAPPEKTLISVVVLGDPKVGDTELVSDVCDQLGTWFGREAARWTHLRTYRISHALPDQSPPTADPTAARPVIQPGLFVCGEAGSLPGIQWALLSGRRAADAVVESLDAMGSA